MCVGSIENDRALETRRLFTVAKTYVMYGEHDNLTHLTMFLKVLKGFYWATTMMSMCHITVNSNVTAHAPSLLQQRLFFIGNFFHIMCGRTYIQRIRRVPLICRNMKLKNTFHSSIQLAAFDEWFSTSQQHTIGLDENPITCVGGAYLLRQFTLFRKGERSTVFLELCRARVSGAQVSNSNTRKCRVARDSSPQTHTQTRIQHTHSTRTRAIHVSQTLRSIRFGIPVVCAYDEVLYVYWYAERFLVLEWGDSAWDFVYYWGAQHVDT